MGAHEMAKSVNGIPGNFAKVAIISQEFLGNVGRVMSRVLPGEASGDDTDDLVIYLVNSWQCSDVGDQEEMLGHASACLHSEQDAVPEARK
eukprot:1137728-Pelagomonas_calceolata.AAC.2